MLTKNLSQRIWGIVGLVSVFALVLSLFPGSSPLASADPPKNQGVRGFSTCVASSGTGSVAVVFDESSSLQVSDPDNNRVPAAQILINRLTEMATALNATIDARVWTFAVDSKPVGSWRTLDEKGAQKINSDVAKLAEANAGFETDYWSGLVTVSSDLRQHSKSQRPDSPTGCSLLVILSDGEFLIDVRQGERQEKDYGTTKKIPGVEEVLLTTEAGAKQVQEAAIDDLCRSGGVADVLRSDEIFIVGVGLSPSKDNAPDFSLLKSVVVGPTHGTKDAKTTCGDLQPRGQFVQASDVKTLLTAFDASSATGTSTTPTDSSNQPLDNVLPCGPTGTCPKENRRNFVIDGTLTTLTLLAVFDEPGIQFNILSPKVEALPDPKWIAIDSTETTGSMTIGEVPVSYTWYSTPTTSTISVTLDGKAQPVNWSGKWQIYFRDTLDKQEKSPGRVNVTFRSDFSVRTSTSTNKDLVLGSKNDIGYDLTRLDGTIITALDPAPKSIKITSRLEQGSNSATITSAEAKKAMSLISGRKVSMEIPEGFTVGKATIVNSVTITTAGGLKLEPSEIREDITIRAPYILPSVISTSVDFGTIKEVVPSTATIEVKGPGCVWLDTKAKDFATFTVLPQGLDPQALEFTTATGTAGDCLSLAPNETRKLSLTMIPASPASGEMRGTLSIHLVPEESMKDEVVTTLPLRASFEPKANPVVVGVVMTLSLLIGLGLPFLALWWTRRRAARFPKNLTSIQATAIKAIYSQGIVQPETTSPTWSFLAEASSGGRRTQITRSIRLQTKSGIRLNEPGYAEVISDGQIGVGSLAPYTLRNGSPVIGLGLANQWAFLADSAAFAADPNEVRGELVLFVSAAKPHVERVEDIETASTNAAERLGVAAPRLATMSQTGKNLGKGSSKGTTIPTNEPTEPDIWGSNDPGTTVDDSVWDN